MSDAALIRRAAKLLRERAQAATPGPWVPSGYGDFGPGVRFEGGQAWDNMGIECDDTEDGWATCRYLALVSPEIALAVADWLEDAPAIRHYAPAAKVARAILAAEPAPSEQ